MSGHEKTRPVDNLHCFRGLGLPYWRDKARGLKPVFASGRDGHYIDYQTDDMDLIAKQNGGLSNPQQRAITGRTIARFIGSKAPPAKALLGPWWIDLDSLLVIRDWALAKSISLSEAAQRLLVLPESWSDCGALILARPKGRLMAWVGKGKPVGVIHGAAKDKPSDFSPDGRKPDGSRPAQGQVFDRPPDSNIEQYFIPGEPLSAWLNPISYHRILSDGKLDPPLG